MRENRTYGSEGGGTGYSTGPPYPYREAPMKPMGIRCVVLRRGAQPCAPNGVSSWLADHGRTSVRPYGRRCICRGVPRRAGPCALAQVGNHETHGRTAGIVFVGASREARDRAPVPACVLEPRGRPKAVAWAPVRPNTYTKGIGCAKLILIITHTPYSRDEIMSNYLERITVDPNICHGAPCIKGTRIMVWLILEYMANGDSMADILDAYPGLTREDILACLAYASETARQRIVPIEMTA
ncbi:MAG: DUF433 domain-containing protein [Thermodesulfobacteriota bacterium]